MKKTTNTVHISRFWIVRFKDNAGNEHKVRINTSSEFCLKLKNGDTMYCTFSGLKTEKKPDGKTFLSIGVLMTPGYMEAIKSGENTPEIDTADIEELYQVDSKYIRSRRSAKSIEVDKNSTRFSFAFDTKKFSTQYKITVFRGEFVSLVYHQDEEDHSRTLYGEITDVDGDDIIFTQYRASAGVRSINKNVRIPSQQAIGIYRYELQFVPHVDKEKNEDAEEKEKAPEVEKTEEATTSESKSE